MYFKAIHQLEEALCHIQDAESTATLHYQKANHHKDSNDLDLALQVSNHLPRSRVRRLCPPGGRFTKNLKITIHPWDIFTLLEKHHWCHCKSTNYSYDYI